MAISANSVIHYTDRIDSLKGILTCKGFIIKYCNEDIDVRHPNALSISFPMVCFCDIPLSEIKNHIDSYGSYGIGLTKNWAKKAGLNPVLYIEKSSTLAENIKNQGNRIHAMLNGEQTVDKDLVTEYTRYLAYSKNYEGRLVKGKINDDAYRFYNEREWRFIAQSDILNGAPELIDGDTYHNDKEKFNNKISNCYLHYSHSDISYLIVDNEDEIPEILKTLNDVYEDDATAKELKILSTKIMTKNQIWNDF